jgi:hypothetical protein
VSKTSLGDLAEQIVRESLNFDEIRWRPVGVSTRPAGKNAYEWTWADLDAVREESRHIYRSNEFAIGGTDCRVGYILGDGLQYEFVARKGVQVAPLLLKELNAWLADWLALNCLDEIEEETFLRLDRDGEAFLRLFTGDDPTLPEVRFVEPERVRSPAGDDGVTDVDRMGVRTAKGDAQTVEGYWIEPEPNEEAEPVDAAEVVHLKANTDSSCRRGCPVYYPVFENLYRCEDLLTSMSAMAVARAKIAVLIKSANLTREKAEDVVSRLTSSVQTAADGSAQRVTIEKMPFGSIVRTNAGDDWQMPSADVGSSDVVNVLQADLRAVGVRMVMPEWMFTGLADAKYSNAFVVESPTLKRFRRLQRFMAQRLGEWNGSRRSSLVWKAALLSGRWANVLDQVGVKVTAPSLESRDKQSEAVLNRTYVDMGVKDVQLVQEEIGVDPDVMARIKAEKAKADAAQQQPPGPTPPPAAGGPVSQPGTPQPPGPPDLMALLGRTTESLAAVAERLASGPGEWLTESRQPVYLAGEWYEPDALEWVLEGRDRSHLVKTPITRKDGVKTFVWKRPEDVAKTLAANAGAGGGEPPSSSRSAAFDAELARQLANTRLTERFSDPARPLSEMDLTDLADDLANLTRDQIRAVVRERGLKVGGKKRELADRLLADAKRRLAGQAAAEPEPPLPTDPASVKNREAVYAAIDRAGGLRLDYGGLSGRLFGEPGRPVPVPLAQAREASGLPPADFDAAVAELQRLGIVSTVQARAGTLVERGYAHDDYLPSGAERRSLLQEIGDAVKTDAATVSRAVRALGRSLGSLFGGGRSAEPPPPVAPYAPASVPPAARPTVDRIIEGLPAAASVSGPQRRRYAEATRAVAARIPAAGHERITANLKGTAFHGDADVLTDSLLAGVVAASPDDGTREWAATQRELIQSGRARPYAGAYVPASGRLYLDGPPERGAGRFAPRATEEQVYAHEIGHVIDGPDFGLSRSPAWQTAWRAEIATPASPLTEYAATQPHEGLAEFARLVYGTGHDLTAVEQAFPQASKFWKERGLWPV